LARLRNLSLLAAVAIAVAVMASALLVGKSDTEASVSNDGIYDLAVAAPSVVGVGSSFIADVSVNAGPETEANYSAVQWKVDYDQSIVSFVVANVGPDDTGFCSSSSDDGDTTLLGCIDLTPAIPSINMAGIAWQVEYMCNNPGPAFLNLVEATPAPSAKTFVKINVTEQPLEITNDTVICALLTDIKSEKTAPPLVTAGSPVVYTVKGTNLGPNPWTGVVVADNLPDDSITFVSATFTADLNGDAVDDIGPLACAPGFFPGFPNPFTPMPAFLVNVVACAGPPSIASGGSMTVTITVNTDADACNQTLVNIGFAGSTDDFGGTQAFEADLLDGVDGTENNFSNAITQIGNCTATVTKAGPAGGLQGDADSYTLTVTNAGPSNATNVNITDVVPAGLTVTGVVGDPPLVCGNVGNNVSCTAASLPPGVYNVTISFTEDAAGTYCNTANSTWTRNSGIVPNDPPNGPPDTRVADGTSTSNEHCFTVIPPFNGLVKSVDPDGAGPLPPIVPGSGEDTILINLWLCSDQATDGVDNDGNSTVDDEDPTCQNNGEGSLEIGELIFTREDCDTRNDDDDDDGEPVSNDPNSPGYRPECPEPTIVDYTTDSDGDGNGNVDKDGGELPEGLGAFEFQLKFNHKLVDIEITEATVWVAPGRTAICTMTIITENDIRFGCVTTGTALGYPQVSGALGATITVTPEADLVFRIMPGKDNGVTTRLLDENCEVADIYGDIFPFTNAGLTQDCTDVDLTIRRLEGDLDGDCDVDVIDSQRIAFRYGSFFGQLLYGEFYDLEPFVTGDFDIDIKDLQFVFGRIGSDCSDPLPDNQDPLPADGMGTP
jgi:uncharacterized repeat protein (TIGR01451 family)